MCTPFVCRVSPEGKLVTDGGFRVVVARDSVEIIVIRIDALNVQEVRLFNPPADFFNF